MSLTSNQNAQGYGYYNNPFTTSAWGGQPGQPPPPQYAQNIPYPIPERYDTLRSDGTLKSRFELDVTKRRPDSPWLKMQLEKERMQFGGFREQALRDNMNSQTSSFNNLASTGGLSSGARERVGQTGIRSLAATNANLANQSAQNRLGLRTQDFVNQVNADKWNIGNNFGEINSAAQHDWQVYDTQAKAWAANQLARAYGGGSGGVKASGPMDALEPGQRGFNAAKASTYPGGSDQWSWKNQLNPMNWSMGGNSISGWSYT